MGNGPININAWKATRTEMMNLTSLKMCFLFVRESCQAWESETAAAWMKLKLRERLT